MFQEASFWVNERPPTSKSGIRGKGFITKLVRGMKKGNGEGTLLLVFHVAVVDYIFFCLQFKIERAILLYSVYIELDYVNANWYEVILARTCRDVCILQCNDNSIVFVECLGLDCTIWRFAWIRRHRQHRQLRRLCCETILHCNMSGVLMGYIYTDNIVCSFVACEPNNGLTRRIFR